MNKKQDLRVIKTRNQLYNTLIELMKDQSFEEIKVSDICNRALINRSTFYSHYNDKYDLLVDFINTEKENLTEILDKNDNILNTKEYYIALIKILLDHIEDKKDIYFSVMMNNRNSIMMDILYDVVDHDIKKRFQFFGVKEQEIPNDIITKFYLGAVINVGIEWLRSNQKYTKQQIVEYLDKLLPNNIQQI